MPQDTLSRTKLRVVFMGTPDFAGASFKALVSTEKLIAAVTQPDRPKGRKGVLTPPPIKTEALCLGIPVFQPEHLKKSPELTETLLALKPDLIVVVAFGQILPESILQIPKYGCINVHASLLPKYRGAGPIQWAIIQGETETGVTTMQMDAGMDTGPMLLKRSVRIAPDETAQALSLRLAEVGASLLLETLSALKAGTVFPQAQDSTKATLAPLLKKEDGLVCWEVPAPVIYNRWRGLFPWPGSTVFYQNERWKITALRIGEKPHRTGLPGEILGLSEKGLEIAAGEGYIVIKGLRPEGKKAMTPLEYAVGHRIETGAVLQQSRT